MTEAVMALVRDRVIQGEMRPGVQYSVYRLAEELGVSRSPVRDALLRLEEAGLVRFRRNRGFEIVPTFVEDVVEIFAIRISLEVAAARRAADRREDAFAGRAETLREEMIRAAHDGDEVRFFAHDARLHGLVFDTAGLPRSGRVVQQLRTSTRLLGASTAAGHARGYHDIIAEHDPVIAAIVAGDARAAGESMRAHIEHTARLLVAQSMGVDDQSEADEMWGKLSAYFPAVRP
ncbi:GntR family transcriptional regulator [Micrococcus luteus]|uniref:GntR family transcriptional regulator n=1 Tax=Micrococcus luteus TaxID=1270 RepID=UPI001642EA11|nr:GntR family transcriptional regulator [Micrococcus luteus]